MLVVLKTAIQIETVVIPQNTIVFIDQAKSIAFWNDMHFDIDSTEYALMN